MISRVTVDLPLVPVIEIAGIRRSSSRIHEGGVVDADAIRASQRSTSRCCVPVSRTRRPDATERPARSTAASAIARERSAPDHGQVRFQRPASAAWWTRSGPACSPWSARSRRAQAATSATASGQSRDGTGRASRTSADADGIREPCHACVRPTATSTLTTGSSR